MATVRPLGENDLGAYIRLRQQALHDAPLAFAASPEDDFASDPDELRGQLRRAPDWVLFGAFDGFLVGSAGLLRDRHRKAAHKMHLWGMYVASSHRHHGVGRALLDAAVAHARSVDGVEWVHLGVSSVATEARALYERSGFVAWGCEPAALRVNGVTADETRMALRL